MQNGGGMFSVHGWANVENPGGSLQGTGWQLHIAVTVSGSPVGTVRVSGAPDLRLIVTSHPEQKSCRNTNSPTEFRPLRALEAT